ncbi:protein TolA [Lysobacteraceae bacterium NML95-0200]|nr:protein TolA [Xanthomonadaceae bacterium NML95-0200]
MRESRADTVQAVALAVVLHLLLAALIFIGFGWLRKTAEPAAGAPVVEAEMVDIGDLSARMQRVLGNRQEAEAAVAEPEPAPLPEALEETEVEAAPQPPQPEPEPARQEAVKPPQPAPQPPQVKPDTREQEEARREAINREKREREQEARRRQEQIELQRRQEQQAAEQKRRQAEQQARAEAEARTERETRARAEAEQRRRRAEAEAKARAEREARAKAEADAKARAEREARARALAEARAQQQADAQARAAARSAGTSGNSGAAQGQGRDTRGEWLALVVGEIEKQWSRPEEVPRGQRCPIRIRLLPGGEVLSAEVQASCPYSEANRRSVEAAVMRASPLPLKGNENLAIRDFVVNFYPSR